MGTTRITYLAGLDGLRCLAVVAVLLYHADTGVFPGGFLGVEVFFVISGYLITSLLAAEWEQRRGIDLKAFWLRRARRLLPASSTMIVATLAFAVLLLPSEVPGLRGAAVAGLLSVSNWYDVLSQQSYFEAVGRPPLLRHLWSLAVEAQFYALWPPLMLLGLRRGGRRRLLAFALAGAAASAGLRARSYQPGDDPSRVYYGTDTRATGLLLGSALALVWTPADPLRRVGRGLLDGAGLAGLAALACLGLRLDEFDPLLYRGGFAAVGLATAAVIAVAVHPRARLTPGLLGWRPLRWLGLRSYGIYLWH